jgi:hypothetical protein
MTLTSLLLKNLTLGVGVYDMRSQDISQPFGLSRLKRIACSSGSFARLRSRADAERV